MDEIDVLLESHRRRFTVEEYHRMIEAGIIKEDEDVELLAGVIVFRSRQSPPHAMLVRRLARVFIRSVTDEFEVGVQTPLSLQYSEPVPDLSVMTSNAVTAALYHPESAVLVIEVAATTLPLDRKLKLPIYAEAGIPEYWIVDVNARAIEVYTDPLPDQRRYRSRRVVEGGELSPESFHGPTVKLAELFRYG